MDLVLTVFVVFILLCISEFGWRKHWFNNEFGRKFVHITVGSFVAFWPFYLSWNQIRLLSVAFLAVVLLSSYFKVFRAINSVQRPTFGEICFAAVVGLLTFVTQSKGIYAAALLQMSLADGLAAIIGTRYGLDNRYHILGQNKSIAGTGAFIITSLILLVGYSLFTSTGLPILAIVGGTLIAAALENVAPLGLDNLFVPLFIGMYLTILT